MRILHTESMGVEGGQTRRVVDELLIIKERGYNGWLVCRSNSWLYEYATKRGVDVLTAPLLNPLDILSTIKLVKYIHELEIDIIHSHDSKDGYPALYAAKLTGKKYVRGRHNDLTKKPGILYKYSDLIITTGSKIKKELISEGIEENKIISIPSYPDERLFRPLKEIREIEESLYETKGKIVIATMSGLSERKRPHLILWALAVLSQKYPDILYIVAGPEGKQRYRKEFFALVKKYGLEDIVKYVGHVTPDKFLNIVDIYVCASRKEGIPQSIMQSMMMECAVVTTDVGSVRDLNIRNNLLIVESDENVEKNMRLMLEILLSDRDHMRQLGKKNRELAMKFFNRRVMGDMLIDSYQKILGGANES